AMAELSQGDIQKAVQAGVNSLHQDIARLSSQLQALPDLRQPLMSLQRDLRKVAYLQRQAAALDKRTFDLVSEIQELKLRISYIERYCAFIYAQYVETEEDQG
ncbi:MAG TPA: hypothetical protein VFK03_00840, partial [Candidatus Saccharimonadales bacterium]|nr:hypothetical protein [Candidatus Saccharimonadales bacterium]